MAAPWGGPAPSRLREDLWVIPVPVPYSRIRCTLAHAILADTGVFLVDPGPDCSQTHTALAAGLAHLGATVADVRGILVTHHHHDHYGIAPRLRRESGAWVALSERDGAFLDARRNGADVAARRRWFRAAGVPDSHLDALCQSWLSTARTGAPAPDIRLADGQLVPVPRWTVRAVSTPGHTAGHLCYHAPERGVLFTGDHVLPSITPHVPASPESSADPLGDYLDSLDRVRALTATTVLPAHRGQVTDLTGRVEEIRSHHRVRLGEHERAVTGGRSTAWEVAGALTWSTPWSRLDLVGRRQALEETTAHLIRLCRDGRITSAGDAPVRWRAVPGAGGHPDTASPSET